MNRQPELEILIQPVNKSRFRYASETGSHGGLHGQCSKGNKVYPTVKLKNYHDWRSVQIQASLYTKDKKTKHVLELKGKNSKNSISIEKLKEDFTATFKTLSITSRKKDDAFNVLLDQKIKEAGLTPTFAQKERLKKEWKSEILKEIKDNSNSVTICFQAFIDNDPLTPPIFSNVIDNQKAAVCGDLKIHRMSQCAGNWRGGYEVILLCDKIQKENVEIRFFETENDNIIWSSIGTFSKADVHYQVAITFKVPPYRENADKTVSVCLARSGEESPAIEFSYYRDDDIHVPKKRKMADDAILLPIDEFQENSSPLDIENNFFTFDLNSPDLFENISNFFPEDSEFNSSAFGEITTDSIGNQCFPPMDFSDDSDSETSVGEPNKSSSTKNKNKKQPSEKSSSSSGPSNKHARRIKEILSSRDQNNNNYLHHCILNQKNILNVLKIGKLMSCDLVNEQNFSKETPLHLAVKGDDHGALESLLKYGGNPLICDVKGNTCFHVAVENNSFNCLSNLTSSLFLPTGLTMFNKDGLTLLHLAVIKNAEKCFNYLLRHPKLSLPDIINIKEKERGRTILHIAVAEESSLVSAILEHNGVDVNAQDFDGNTPLHIACAVENINISIIKQLLDSKANPSILNFKKNSEKGAESPVDFAADCPEVLKMLNESFSSLENLEKKLCVILDPPSDKWMQLGICMGMEDDELKGIETFSSSPTKILLSYIQRQNPENGIERLIEILKVAELPEALEVIRSHH